MTAVDLALMGATLADGGVYPVTRARVAVLPVCRAVLAAMTTAGLYETSGDWLHDIGLPGKSGIGGGIVTFSPGKGGLGSFAPPLDRAGNSVRGQRAAAALMLQRTFGTHVSGPLRDPSLGEGPANRGPAKRGAEMVLGRTSCRMWRRGPERSSNASNRARELGRPC